MNKIDNFHGVTPAGQAEAADELALAKKRIAWLESDIRELRVELDDETALRKLVKELPEAHLRADRLQAMNWKLLERVNAFEKALQKICIEGDFTHPERMKFVARAALERDRSSGLEDRP